MMGGYMMTAVYSVVFMVTGFIAIELLGLSGQTANIARMVLTGLALSLGGLLTWFKQRREKAKAAKEKAKEGAPEEAEDTGALLDLLVRDAQARLSKSRLGKDAKLGQLPVFFLFGEEGVAKTSNFVASGVEPELLAGQVHYEGRVAPTRPANFWYAKQSVFVEAGGRLAADSSAWKRLAKKLQPKRKFATVFGKKDQAPRAAVVFVDGEKLVESGAEEALQATARRLHNRLSELCQTLGVNLPVYAVFTKTDRIAFFTEYFGNLSDEEAQQVFGVTLKIRTASSEGVYGEEEGRRLSSAFKELFYSLCEKRAQFLAREHDDAKRAEVYEFPREFGKIRAAVTRFLVELCRPSELQASPFLRGFYFTGVRPVTIEERAPVARASRSRSGGEGSSDATGIFDLDGGDERESMRSAPSVRRRRVPQWVFLGRLFNDVILKDQAALGASGASVHSRMLRRILLGAAAGLFLIWSVALTVSYVRNRALEDQVIVAARGIGAFEGGGAGQGLPSLDALTRLDTLRQSVEMLSDYRREGPPLSLRWGLYVGNRIAPPAEELYFNRFHQLMFGATQASLLQWMRGLPARPGEEDEYAPSYNTLKAYLITTYEHRRSTVDFLSPFLFERWLAGRQIDTESRLLAERQFEFYAKYLQERNPYSTDHDEEAVYRARRYLAGFQAVDRIYAGMISQASAANPSVNFNRDVEGSAAYVVNNTDVSGAFTREGWEFIQERLGNVRQLYEGELWVLGEDAFEQLDMSGIEPELRRRYREDFIGNWRKYLQNSSIVGYRGSVQVAARQLSQLASNNSHLIALFCLASRHTDVSDEEILKVYQPLHLMAPPASCSDQFIHDGNGAYMSGLASVHTSIESLAASPNDDSLKSATLDTAVQALSTTRITAQKFNRDPAGVVNSRTQKLMEDPITYAQGVVGVIDISRLNGGGAALCKEFFNLESKYPFETDADQEASLGDVNAVFRPGDGRLWSFYEGYLRNYVNEVGGRYSAKSGGDVTIRSQFLEFFNRAAAFSRALYPNEATQPRLSYFMQSLPADGVESLTLTLDGQTLEAGPRGGGPKEFIFPGTGVHGARMAGSLGGPQLGFMQFPGLWAAFRLFGASDRFEVMSDGKYRLDWVPRQGNPPQPITVNGRALTLPFILDMKGAPPIFRPGYLSGFGCVSRVAQ